MFGELCLSPDPVFPSMTKSSPQSVQGLMMGMWFLASAYGHVAGLLGAGMSSADPNATNTEKLVTRTATPSLGS